MFFKLSWMVLSLGVLAGCATNEPVQKRSTVKPIKAVTQTQDEMVFKQYQKDAHGNGSITNLTVDYSGKYKFSKIDEHLLKTYHRRYTYKTYKNKKRTYTLPSYDYLKMTRAGPGWKISVEEKVNGTFTIKGKNSTGKQLNGVCKTLKQCFEML